MHVRVLSIKPCLHTNVHSFRSIIEAVIGVGAFDHLEWANNGAFEQLFGLRRGEFEQRFSNNLNGRGVAQGEDV